MPTLVAVREPYLQPGLRRDRQAAAELFRFGPRAIRDLRLRHGVRAGPLSRDGFERLIRAEIEAAVGPFEVVAAAPAPAGLGQSEARGRIIGDALRRLRRAAANGG